MAASPVRVPSSFSGVCVLRVPRREEGVPLSLPQNWRLTARRRSARILVCTRVPVVMWMSMQTRFCGGKPCFV